MRVVSLMVFSSLRPKKLNFKPSRNIISRTLVSPYSFEGGVFQERKKRCETPFLVSAPNSRLSCLCSKRERTRKMRQSTNESLNELQIWGWIQLELATDLEECFGVLMLNGYIFFQMLTIKPLKKRKRKCSSAHWIRCLCHLSITIKMWPIHNLKSKILKVGWRSQSPLISKFYSFIFRVRKGTSNRRFLQCPGMMKIKQLKKFVRMKYGLSEENFAVRSSYQSFMFTVSEFHIQTLHFRLMWYTKTNWYPKNTHLLM